MRSQQTAAANKPSTYSDDDEHSKLSMLSIVTPSTSGNCHRDGEMKKAKKLVHLESQAVSCLRVFLSFVLIVSAVAVSTIAYYYIQQNEDQSFRTDHYIRARRIIELFQSSFQMKLSASDAFSVAITSHALSSGSKFPFVTLPHFAIQGSTSRVLSDGVETAWLPLVTDETRQSWEKYSNQQQGWIDDALEEESTFRMMQDKEFFFRSKNPRSLEQKENKTFVLDNNSFCTEIYGITKEGTKQIQPNGLGPYLPYWQMSPVLPVKNSLNFDMLNNSNLRMGLEVVLDTENAVLTKGFQTRDQHRSWKHHHRSSISEQFLHASQYRFHMERYNNTVSTDLIYPVFNQFGKARELVGVLYSTIYWNFFLRDVHSEHTHGVVVILENSQNQTFSFLVSGEVVKYLGSDDLHDPSFDDLEVSGDIALQMEQQSVSSPETWSYTKVELDTNHCRYKLRIYPSHLCGPYLHLTKKPMKYATVIASIFAFTCIIFCAYDGVVRRRQNIVFRNAVRLGAVVSSLFPETVRDRLFEAQQHPYDQQDNNNSSSYYDDFSGHAGNGMIRFRGSGRDRSNSKSNNDSTSSSNNNDNELFTAVKPSAPIADHFQNTTIMFGDLAGFTAWSAGRGPDEVFHLLETIYSAFDDIATRRRVFKVETIGDCYVAVTGIPHAQKYHALIMTKFANDCMIKLNELTCQLRMTLGEDTANLLMRIGLNSGAVTAGVLRGQKSRFQLFGDTMNTASRMESNGIKGRIHISESTANELHNAGKSHWISPREETIIAKGKGEMQTYWVTVKPKVHDDEVVMQTHERSRSISSTEQSTSSW